MSIKILHLEDNKEDANLVKTLLTRSDPNFEIQQVSTKEEFELALTNADIDVILADYTIPNYNGIEALQVVKIKKPNIPFILLSGTIGEERLIEVFRLGATDFISKNNIELVDPAIKRVLKEAEEKNKRVLAEEHLQNSLIEKESMLKEIYHRVKNNLQVVSSTLNLQVNRIKDPAIKSVFIESATRVHSMALVHEMLYCTKNLSQIELSDYVNRLSKHLLAIYVLNSTLIKFVIDAEQVKLNIKEAVPCGLIINELISNSLKYAFPAKQQGEIHITIKKNQNIINLFYQDNGVGLPPDFDLKNTSTLGMQLITSLTKQLGGQITLANESGLKCNLIFSLEPLLNDAKVLDESVVI